MAASILEALAPALSDVIERALSQRLCDGDSEALMELYDDIAPLAYGWAVHVTRSKRKALLVVKQAFTRAATEPQVFCDRRVSSRGWILVEVHHRAWAVRPIRRRAAGGRAATAAAVT